MLTDNNIQIFALIGIIFLALIKIPHRSRSHPFPPGPGRLWDLPAVKPWVVYMEWSKRYGALFHLRIFNEHIIVINSLDTAKEILNKRAALTSDRPVMAMTALTGWDFNFGLLGHTERWRQCRRLAHQAFTGDAIAEYRPIQTAKTRDFLKALLEDPQNWMEHNRRLSGAIAMATLYGYDIAPQNDYFVSIADHAMVSLGKFFMPGAFAVNTIPALQKLPSWFPGCGFQEFAATTRKFTAAMRTKPFKFVKGNMQNNTSKPCLVKTLLETNETRRMQGFPREEEANLEMVAATVYAAASHTTVSAMGTFILAMTLYPGVVAKAQDQLDRVLGKDRLPTHEDRQSLPYIEAIVREVSRFRPVLPLGAGHVAGEDDLYEGYFIPKGCILWPNVWAMSRDEKMYPDPEVFNPERFFNPDGTLNDDDVSFTFGFGRRICVGRHFANATMWLAMASFLAMFNVGKAKDKDGNDVPVIERYSDSVFSQPDSFKCTITPRSKQVVGLIMAEVV
ncbi:cytochrome P450 [Mycena floridula]|nr:cytochrome P450 [Mycena floridula]